jgi:hypothetical protein
MSWKNHLKEKLVDAARRIADKLPTVARYTAGGRLAPAGFVAVPFLVPTLFLLRRVRAR